YDASMKSSYKKIGLGCILMQQGKANVVADALSRLSMKIFSHIEDDKKELVREVQRFARFGVCLVDSQDGRVIVQNG
ncbi:hypothetical protein MTR67_002215, partial [Solanum verrucosum]